ncbi:MAG: FABP family protein [Acidobacteriota bacterium]|nr:FABP family protein [Acidobacteriota bacterium]
MTTVDETMRFLLQLEGAWQGWGHGEFPTIEPFRYREELRFQADGERPLLFYEQRARLVDDLDCDVKNSHWESGFFLAKPDHRVVVHNAQTGRIEIMEGKLSLHDAGCLTIDLGTTVFAGDDRMVAAMRKITLVGECLEYRVAMHTRATEGLVHHLAARLERAPAGDP